jgi:DNA polymerase-3 subunit alpha
MENNFVHLHVHSHYSILDGIIKIPELIAAVKDKGQKGVALTDHGNLFGMVEFYSLAQKSGIKPIIGCEVYICEDLSKKDRKQPLYHLVLLAENQTGLSNLIKLVSISYMQGFYRKPRIDYDLLGKYREGLIALSACLKGEVSSQIVAGNFLEAEEAILKYQKIMGYPNFYLEMMNHHLSEEKIVNEYLPDFSDITGAKIVATNDVHFLSPEDYEAHLAILAIKTGSYLDEKSFGLNDDSYYLKTYTQMLQLFPAEYLENTVEVFKRCNLRLHPKMHLPSYQLPPGEKNSYLYLKKIARQKLKEEWESKNYTVEEQKISSKRLEYELSVIGKMGFSDYFLIVADLISYARGEEIMVGPGRGSAAGSFLSYLLGITKINPLKYDLLFERFLNPERISMPDIDIDFSDRRRKEVIDYVKEKYGEQKVAQIITFGKEKARNAIKDVCRVLKVPYTMADQLTKAMPKDHKVTLEDSYKESEKFHLLVNSTPTLQRAYQIALRLEGINRNISTHAAGVVIGDKELMEYVPLYKSESEGELTTQLDKDGLEYMGLLKMDFLGLKTLSIIEEVLELIQKNDGVEIDIDNISLEDKKTYKLLSEGNTLGVFQLENQGMMDLLRKYRPECIEDIVALVALWRPGPLRSGMVDEFIKRKRGELEISYLHPWLEDILKPTYGVIVYQEQVMQIASRIGGFSMAEADFLRKAMSKKQEAAMQEMERKFIEGAQKQGISEEVAVKIFSLISYFSGYGFNKSHSVCYAYIAYQTAYLKANYPIYFMAALLNSEIHNSDKLSQYIKETEKMGINILPPALNTSYEKFVVKGDKTIAYALAAVKNVGEKAAQLIVEERKKGKFKDILDFFIRVPEELLNVKLMDSLNFAGVFKNEFGFSILGVETILEKLMDVAHRKKEEIRYGQISFFSEESEKYIPKISSNEYSLYDLLKLEREYLGIYLSGHPLEKYRKFWEIGLFYPISNFSNDWDRNQNLEKKALIAGIIENRKEKKTKKGNRMAFTRLEDLSGLAEVIVFPDVYKNFFSTLEPGNLVVMETIYEKERDSKFILQKMWLLSEFFQNNIFEINFYIDSSDRVKKLSSVLTKLKGNNCYVIMNLITKSKEVEFFLNLKIDLSVQTILNLLEEGWEFRIRVK